MSVTRESATDGFKLYTNGIFDGSVTVGSVTGFPYNTNMFVGAFRNASTYASFDGDYGEMIFYNRVLGEEERQQIENYLINKWSL